MPLYVYLCYSDPNADFNTFANERKISLLGTPIMRCNNQFCFSLTRETFDISRVIVPGLYIQDYIFQ